MDPLAHASIGLMVKPVYPKAPLWALLTATQVPDLLCFGLMAAGIEHDAVTQLDLAHGVRYLSQSFIAWSHGFFMSIVWSLAVAAIAFILFRDRRVALVVGLMVLSHWMLDFIVYSNLPLLFDNSQFIGIGLITSGPGIMIGIILEIGLIAGGIATFWVTRKRTTVQARG